MSRQHIRDIQSKGYFVTEKTDGVRYLLVVVKDIQNRPTAFLINRSCEVFTMLGGTVTGAMLGEETVLDGELVFNLTYKRQVFIVFDALRIDGESLVQQRFASRYEAIHTRINPRLIRLCSETDNKLENFTYIARKIFVKSNDVSWLFSRVCLEDGERVFRESFKRHHKTDGLIFQPDGPYFDFSSSGRLLKWKYLDTVTVDLEVARSEATGVTLHCSGPDNTTIDCTTQHTLALSDQLRIIADAEVVHGVEVSDFRTIIRLLQEQQLQGKRMIVEVAYEPRFGCWSYRGCRPDKNDPNYVATVFGAYAELAEGISQQELEYRLSCSDRGEDTWEVEVTRSVEVLLSRKRQRTTNGVAKTHH
jgi:mRNA guanylyltransferase